MLSLDHKNKNPECLLYASLYVAEKITFFSYVLHILLRPTLFNKTFCKLYALNSDSFANSENVQHYEFISYSDFVGTTRNNPLKIMVQ